MRKFLYALPLLLALLLYGYVLRLPYFLDDGPHFIILGQTNGLQHWGDFAPFPFYRPLTFSIWKAFATLTGTYPTYMLHALNLFTFGLSGVLVGQLARRIAPHGAKVSAGVLAGCAFVLFPFSYQAVAMVAALFHLTLTFGLLLCLWASAQALDGKGGGWMPMLAYGGAFVGVFSHENGLLLAPFLVGWITALYGWRALFQRRTLRVVVPVLAIVALYAVCWLAFSPNEEARSFTADFPAAFAALFQGIVYPLAALVRPLLDVDATPALILGLVAAGTLPLLLVVERRVWLLGIGGYALAILPAVLFLDAGYVLGQMRLALLASAVGALLWGVSLARMRRVFALPLILLALIVSVAFLDQRRGDLQMLADYNAELVTLANAHEIETGTAAVINAPMNLTPLDSQRRFLLGSEGVLWTDPTLDISQQFWMNGVDDVRGVRAFAHPETNRVQGINLQVQPPPLTQPDDLRDIDFIIATQFNGRTFTPVLVRGVAASTPADVVYPDGGLTLQAADVYLTADAVAVWLRWHADARPAQVSAFVHLTCDGVLVAQADGVPWADTYPFHLWRVGDTLTEGRHIPLPPGTSPGCLRVLVGLYDANTGTRLDAFQGGERLADDAFLLVP